MLLRIENDGPRILSTNYWETELARQGGIYVSINARAFRVLLPRGQEGIVDEMRGALYVIVTAGQFQGYQDSLELLFEDRSDSPFSLHVGPNQVDRRIPAADEGRTDLLCLVYTAGPSLELELPARYRRAQILPYLRPWEI